MEYGVEIFHTEIEYRERDKEIRDKSLEKDSLNNPFLTKSIVPPRRFADHTQKHSSFFRALKHRWLGIVH